MHALQELDFIEHFAGKAVLMREAHDAGLRATALDKDFGSGMDMLQPSGYGTLDGTEDELYCFIICHLSAHIFTRQLYKLGNNFS